MVEPTHSDAECATILSLVDNSGAVSAMNGISIYEYETNAELINRIYLEIEIYAHKPRKIVVSVLF